MDKKEAAARKTKIKFSRSPFWSSYEQKIHMEGEDIMRLVKFFPISAGLEKNINAWVKMAPQQRCILQVAQCKDGVLVVYERYAAEKDEWDAVKRGFEKSNIKV